MPTKNKEQEIHSSITEMTSTLIDSIMDVMHNEELSEEERSVSIRVRFDKFQKDMSTGATQILSDNLNQSEIDHLHEIFEDKVFKKASLAIAKGYGQVIGSKVMEFHGVMLLGALTTANAVFGFVKGIFQKKQEGVEAVDE